jgi:hypothetical protein
MQLGRADRGRGQENDAMTTSRGDRPSSGDRLREAASLLIAQVEQALEGKRTELTNPLEFVMNRGEAEEATLPRTEPYASFAVSLQTLYRRALSLPQRQAEVADLLKTVEAHLREFEAAAQYD